MSAMIDQKRKPPRELTGLAVLLCFAGFFGVVFAVNALLVQVASSTFGGLETGSSYKAGLMFSREQQQAERQQSLHWQVDGRISRDQDGEAVLEINARDARGAPLTGLTAEARLAHPADARLDHSIALTRTSAGTFRGETEAQAGQWELTVDLYSGTDRMFRSHSRVTLR
jgi:nitrogen fixation protein FixH